VSKMEAVDLAADSGAVPGADVARTDRQSGLKRKRGFAILGAVVLSAAVAYGAYSHFYLSRYIATDNAYVAAEAAQVTPTIGGIVSQVKVTDTQKVRAGDTLVVLDDVDARLALDQAEAELGRAARRVRGYVANDRSLKAQLESRASDLQRARIDLERRQALSASGSVSGDELTRARNAFETAAANYAATEGSRDANAVLIAGTTEDNNPEVVLARAKRDQARVNLERTVIRAPVDGVVVRRSVQIGQQVQAGMTLLQVVPLANVHVDANFKEVQLAHVRAGQPVELVSDLYGTAVTYHGVVSGLSGGSGAAFATIPAQNATGNWIKVVQRVPVRIDLDSAELAAHPLEVGLSMTATIDTSAQVPVSARALHTVRPEPVEG
jgi:membrane fusion protein (multidrug efflux system)